MLFLLLTDYSCLPFQKRKEACGVTLIAYRRGGLTEIVKDGETGFLVEPDSVDGLVNANKIDRCACRQQAEVEYSQQAMGDRTEQWFRDILAV